MRRFQQTISLNVYRKRFQLNMQSSVTQLLLHCQCKLHI